MKSNQIILSIKEVNSRIRKAGFLVARIKTMDEASRDNPNASKDLNLVSVHETGLHADRMVNHDFVKDVLSPSLGHEVESCKWTRDDCVIITYKTKVDVEEDV